MSLVFCEIVCVCLCVLPEHSDSSVGRFSCTFSFLLFSLLLIIFLLFLIAGVCVARVVFPSVGLVCTTLPSLNQPKLSGSKGVTNGVTILSWTLFSCWPSWASVSDVAKYGVYPICVTASLRCTNHLHVCTCLAAFLVAISTFDFETNVLSFKC